MHWVALDSERRTKLKGNYFSCPEAVVAKGVNIRFGTVEDCVECLVDVSKSSSPVYADTIKGKEPFYIRVGNTTRILTGAEMVKYAKDHF